MLGSPALNLERKGGASKGETGKEGKTTEWKRVWGPRRQVRDLPRREEGQLCHTPLRVLTG